MVNTMGPYPLFCYVYSPAVPVRQERSRRRGAPQAEMGDGGFSLALYSDGTLVHFQYDVTKTMLLQQNVFDEIMGGAVILNGVGYVIAERRF